MTIPFAFNAPRQALALLAVAALPLLSQPAAAAAFRHINLVTDDPSANAAPVTDASLKNAWGISYLPTGPFWVSDNATHVSTIYRVDPATNATTKLGLTVTIPGAGNVTGQFANTNTGAPTPAFNGDAFVFASEDGTISGWRGALGSNAEILRSGSPDNVYKGLAEATVGGNPYAYAANFKAGTIDVIKGIAGSPDLPGNFVDPALPAGYAPFNIQKLNGELYVSYALQDAAKTDDAPGAGRGFVSVFDTQGNFQGRIASGGTLNSPWGLAIAPASFGSFANTLLVGNFGDGRINAFNLADNSFAGQLSDAQGTPLAIDGLWGLTVGNGVQAGSSQAIYFSAGPNGEANGLFGAIEAVPEPAALLLMGLGMLPGLAFSKGRRKAV